MRLLSVKVKNYGPYKELQTIDIPTTGKVAVIGENGSGKSFLFDAIPLALFGKATNRSKGIYDLFNGENRRPIKDGLVEVTFEINGKNIVVRRLVDSISRTQKPFIFLEGSSLTEGKVNEFDSEIKKLGLDESVYLTTAYASQNGSGHLIGLQDSDRRGVFEVILKLGEFSEAHAKVKTYRIERQSNKTKLEAQLDVLQDTLLDIEELERELELSKLSRNELDSKLKHVEIKVKETQNSLTQINYEISSLDKIQNDLKKLESQYNSDINELKSSQEKLQNNEKLLLNKQKVLEAISLQDFLILQNREYTTKLTIIQETINNKLAEYNTSRDNQRSVLSVTLDELQRTVDKVQNERNEAQTNHASKFHFLDSAKKKLPNLIEQGGLVNEVPCKDQESLVSNCKLLVSANKVRQEVIEVTNYIQKTAIELDVLTKIKDGFDALLAEAKYNLSIHKDKLKIFEESKNQDEIIKDELIAVGQIKEKLANNTTEIERLDKLTKLKNNLDVADSRVKDLTNQIILLNSKIEESVSERTRLSELLENKPVLMSKKDSLDKEYLELVDHAQSLTLKTSEIDKQIGRIESDILRNNNTLKTVKELGGKISEVSKLLDKLEVIEEGLSPKGAPALKVDAAGPEVTAIINDLLLNCYGNRFTVRLETQRANKSKDGVREVLQISVIDNESADEAPVENLSGGEQAIVKEAISLGLATFARRHCGIDIKCLLRDETTAPLSDENGERYINMLDRALAVGGFEQILFVSHKQSLQCMADHTLLVENGKVIRS